ncbi:MAG: hypothetical protein AMXMBFR80_15870 [Dehalococcoidia bacterium]|mgnify:FL=1
MAVTAAHVGRQTVSKSIWRNVPLDIATVVLLLIYAFGTGAWIYQINQGLGVTGMRDVVTWGLYITFFMFFVGLSAGGLVVASAATVFGVTRLKPLSRLAIWVAFVSVLLAGLSIVPDIGRPDRLWHIVRYPNWSSPLVWDVAIITIYGVLSLVYLWLHSRQYLAERKSFLTFGFNSLSERAKDLDKRLVTIMAFVALPAAFALHSITAWIFGLQFARPYWFTSILAPWFITSALVSGLGLMLVVMLLLRRARAYEVPNETVTWLGGLLAAFIVADFFLLGAELLTRGWSEEPDGLDAVKVLVTGKYAWVFWSEIGLGTAAFVLMFVRRLRRVPSVVGVAAGLAIVSIFFKRLGLILVGFYEPIVGYEPGISLGEVDFSAASPLATGAPTSAVFAVTGTYTPTWVEYSAIAGLLALGALLIIWGVRLLPLREPVPELDNPARSGAPTGEGQEV